MAPDQKDYGSSDDRALVPGTLTVFRHFQADLRSGVLTPMNYNPKRAGDGYPGDRPGQRAYARLFDTYHAECDRHYRVQLFSGHQSGKHKAPDKDCSCGFYASYDPATDFYPMFKWGSDYARLVGATEYEDLAVVKAAVEVSGTVVMGRLGVRAEKMKIVGLALDWGKRVAPRSVWQYDYTDDLYSRGWIPAPQSTHRYVVFNPTTGTHRYVVFNPTTGEYEQRIVDVEEEGDAEIITQALSLANGYGAAFYSSTDELIKAHPMADISALGIDTTPPPPPTELERAVFSHKPTPPPSAALTQQQALYAQKAIQGASASFKELAKALNDALDCDVFDTVTPKREKKRPVKVIADGAVQRVIDAKKNRPAPPGSGIDRRKRKL